MEADPAIAIFGSEDFDLYDTLGLDKAANAEAIKSAYRVSLFTLYKGAFNCLPYASLSAQSIAISSR